jgi:hypothetical protein
MPVDEVFETDGGASDEEECTLLRDNAPLPEPVWWNERENHCPKERQYELFFFVVKSIRALPQFLWNRS